MKFLGSAKLTTQGQITIPQEIRKILDLQKGDNLIFAQDDEGLIYVTKEIQVIIPQKKE